MMQIVTWWLLARPSSKTASPCKHGKSTNARLWPAASIGGGQRTQLENQRARLDERTHAKHDEHHVHVALADRDRAGGAVSCAVLPQASRSTYGGQDQAAASPASAGALYPPDSSLRIAGSSARAKSPVAACDSRD